MEVNVNAIHKNVNFQGPVMKAEDFNPKTNIALESSLATEGLHLCLVPIYAKESDESHLKIHLCVYASKPLKLVSYIHKLSSTSFSQSLIGSDVARIFRLSCTKAFF